jgi:probable rRNA maturation factor
MRTAPSGRDAGMPTVDVLIESSAWDGLADCTHIVSRAIAAAASQVEWERQGTAVIVLLCDDAAIADLNAQWRGVARPTNVLSFPAPPRHHAVGNEGTPLGDIAIAYETVAREAAEQGKTVGDHCSHLVVHGFLHLLGYDHEAGEEADRMEQLERDILARIGISDPYATAEGHF